MRPLYFGLAAITFSCSAFAQMSEFTQDPAIIKGELDNGLDYVILPLSDTDTRNLNEIRLIIHAGSMHESDQQLGYAHFLEHMAFNGTKKYPKNELIKFIESSGMSFGSDLNAYTSYYETVYKLSTPKDQPALLTQAIDITNEWLFNLDIQDEEVAKEIEVVAGEFRQRLEYEHSTDMQEFTHRYQNHRIAQRSPIGTQESIQAASTEQLTAYYQRWYHPDNATLIISGVLDGKALEQQLIKQLTQQTERDFTPQTFSQAPIPAEPFVSFNADQTNMSIGFYNYSNQAPQHSPASVIEHTQNSLLFSIIENRFAKWVEAEERSPIGSVDVFSYTGMANLQVTGMLASTGFSRWPKALQQLEIERLRLLEFGVGEAELAQAKTLLAADLTSYLQAIDTLPTEHIVEQLIEHSLMQFTLTSETDIVKFMQAQLDSITLEQLNQRSHELFAQTQQWIGTGHNDYKIELKERTVNRLLKQAAKTERLAPVDESAVNASYQLPKVTPQPITLTTLKNGIHQGKLSNGIEVYMYPSQLQPNEISVTFTADTGSWHMPAPLQPYAEVFSSVHNAQGLKDMGQTGTSQALTAKSIYLNGNINATNTYLQSFGQSKDSEFILELMHRAIAEPIDFKHLKDVRNSWANDPDTQQPGYQFQKSFYDLIYGEQTEFLPKQAGFYSGMRDGQIDKVIPYVFAKQGRPRLIVVGDFEPQKLIKQIEQSFASFKLTELQHQPLPIATTPPSNNKEVALNPENKTQLIILYRQLDTSPRTWQKAALHQLATDLLNIELRNVLREENGFSYAPSALVINSNFELNNHQSVRVDLTLEPQRTEQAIESADQVVTSFIKETTTQAQFDEAKARFINQINNATGIHNFSYDINSAIQNGHPLADAFEFDETINSITLEQFNTFKRTLTSNSSRVQILYSPDPKLFPKE